MNDIEVAKKSYVYSIPNEYRDFFYDNVESKYVENYHRNMMSENLSNYSMFFCSYCYTHDEMKALRSYSSKVIDKLESYKNGDGWKDVLSKCAAYCLVEATSNNFDKKSCLKVIESYNYVIKNQHALEPDEFKKNKNQLDNVRLSIELMYLFHVVSFLKELAFSCLDKIINVEKIEKSLCEIKKILSIIDWKYFQESHSLFEILYQKVKNGDKGKI